MATLAKFQIKKSEIEEALKGIVGCERTDLTAIAVKGSDHIDYLHRMSSQNFKILQPGAVVPGAFLNGNGTVVCLFQACVLKDQVRLILLKSALSAALTFLEKFHFGEDLIYSEDARLCWYEFRGERLLDFDFKSIFETEVQAPPGRHPGLWVGTEDASHVASPKKLLPENLKWIESGSLLERIEGIPRDQVDVSQKNILLEIDSESYTHRDKGCYPGQEVIERIFTYGNVAKRIVPIELSGCTYQEAEGLSELALMLDGKKVGEITSLNFCPDAVIGFATILRLKIQSGAIYSLEGSSGKVQLGS